MDQQGVYQPQKYAEAHRVDPPLPADSKQSHEGSAPNYKLHDPISAAKQRCFLDWQSSFSYGGFLNNSKGERARVNSIVYPVAKSIEPIGCNEDIRAWYEALWSPGAPIRTSQDHKGGTGTCGYIHHPHEGLSFEDWQARKAKALQAEKAEKEAQALREKEAREQLQKQSEMAVRSWHKAKAKEAKRKRRELAKERKAAKRASRAARQAARESQELGACTIKTKQTLERKKQRELDAERQAVRVKKENDRLRKKKDAEAFAQWLAKTRKREQEEKRAERERAKREKQRQEKIRQAKWSKKDVVLAYAARI